jgi:hypothetical protein
VHTGLLWENLRERPHLEYLGVGGMITLKWIFKKEDGGVDCIALAEDRDMWWALLNTRYFTFGFHKILGNF